MQTSKKSIKEVVFDNIFNDIIIGEYPVNSIINERLLIEKYGASKSPVREALIELCKENILVSIPRFGYQVVAISPKEICDALELRTIIEISALRKTAEILDEDIIKQLEDNVSKTAPMLREKDIVKHWNQNVEFHLLLCSFCNNGSIYNVLKDILRFCFRGAPQYYWNTWNQSKEADNNIHVKLIDALKDKKFDLAEQLMNEDISAMKDNFFKLMTTEKR